MVVACLRCLTIKILYLFLILADESELLWHFKVRLPADRSDVDVGDAVAARCQKEAFAFTATVQVVPPLFLCRLYGRT